MYIHSTGGTQSWQKPVERGCKMVADVWMLQPRGGCADCTQRCVGGLNLGRPKFLHGVQLRHAKPALSSHGCKTPLCVAYSHSSHGCSSNENYAA